MLTSSIASPVQIALVWWSRALYDIKNAKNPHFARDTVNAGIKRERFRTRKQLASLFSRELSDIRGRGSAPARISG